MDLLIRQVTLKTTIRHWPPFVLVFKTPLAWSTEPTNSFLMQQALIFLNLVDFRFSLIFLLAQVPQLALSIEAPFLDLFTFLIIPYLFLAYQIFICNPLFLHLLYLLLFQVQQLEFVSTLTRF